MCVHSYDSVKGNPTEVTSSQNPSLCHLPVCGFPCLHVPCDHELTAALFDKQRSIQSELLRFHHYKLLVNGEVKLRPSFKVCSTRKLNPQMAVVKTCLHYN